MKTELFHYDLPSEAIAQTPVQPRDAARMLVDLGTGPAHQRVADLDRLLEPGDVVVVNNTRVLDARLALSKPTGGAVEVLLLEPTGNGDEWQALVRPNRRVADGTKLEYDGRPLVEVGPMVSDPSVDGRRLVYLHPDAMSLAGEMPLPPYIDEPLADPDRYQTVFADRPGSVAAPTAGLHLTPELLGRLTDRGIPVETVELFVGLGTFRPIATDEVEDHTMHTERYRVTDDTWRRIQQASRVVAVGTTVVRTLETVAATGVLEGRTDLFISRGYRWRMVDVLLTNFHVPRSSLLVLVDAFLGDRWRSLYRTALDNGYRFLSFGDCMLVRRAEDGVR